MDGQNGCRQLHMSLCCLLLFLAGRLETLAHRVPKGGWFELVSCPHYFAELLIYISFSLVFGGLSLTWWLVVFYVLFNQALAGQLCHDLYLSKFESYPKQRRAFIPYVLWMFGPLYSSKRTAKLFFFFFFKKKRDTDQAESMLLLKFIPALLKGAKRTTLDIWYRSPVSVQYFSRWDVSCFSETYAWKWYEEFTFMLDICLSYLNTVFWSTYCISPLRTCYCINNSHCSNITQKLFGKNFFFLLLKKVGMKKCFTFLLLKNMKCIAFLKLNKSLKWENSQNKDLVQPPLTFKAT